VGEMYLLVPEAYRSTFCKKRLLKCLSKLTLKFGLITYTSKTSTSAEQLCVTGRDLSELVIKKRAYYSGFKHAEMLQITSYHASQSSFFVRFIRTKTFVCTSFFPIF